MSTPRAQRPRRTAATRRGENISLMKDAVLFVLGVALIAWQGFRVPPQDFDPWIMGFGAVLAGVPGWLQIWGLRNSGAPELPLPSVEGPPQPQSSPSSSA